MTKSVISAFRLGPGGRLVVHLVPDAREDPGPHVEVPGGDQPVGHVVRALAVVRHGVLVAGQDQHRQPGREPVVPAGGVDLVVQVDEALEEPCAQRGAEVVEGVTGVVGDDVGVQGHPGGRSGVRTEPLEEAGEQLPHQRLRRRFRGVVARCERGQRGPVDHLLDPVHLGGDPAQHQPGERRRPPVGRHAPRDHRPPAVPVDHPRQPGRIAQPVASLGLQPQGVGHDDPGGVVTRVGPDTRLHGRAAVPGVVTGHDDEPGVEQRRDQVQVAPGVLAQAVHDLDDRPWGADGFVEPRLDGVPAVRRGERDLLQGHEDRLPPPAPTPVSPEP